MSQFQPLRVQRSANIQIDAPPQLVFPLFQPEGERHWADDWDPTPIFPASGDAERSAIFSTMQHGSAPTIWCIADFDPQSYRVRYVRVAPDSHVAEIAVACAAGAPGQTQAQVSYLLTGLSERGNAYVENLSEAHYQEWMDDWQRSINAYLSSIGAA